MNKEKIDGRVKGLLDKLPRPRGDVQIMLIVAIMLTISVVEVFSASSRLSFGDKSYMRPMLSHGAHIVVAVLAMYGMQILHYKKYKGLNVVFLVLSIVMLLVLTIKGLFTDKPQRWFDLIIIQFQPSELAKLSTVLTNAFLLAKLNVKDELSQMRTFRSIVILTGIFILMIVSENLSTAIIIGVISYIMMMIGGISGRRILKLSIVLAIAGSVAVAFLLTVPAQTLRESKIIPGRAVTWQNRIKDMLSGDESKLTAAEYSRTVAKDKPQETHARIAVASSGIIGKLPGNSHERDFLQEASCDMIYAIIIEELGLLGALVVLALYLWLMFRAGRIAAHCKKKYPAYLSLGLGIMICLPAFVNMSVAVGLGPVTGQAMPLISNGGSSMLVSGLAIGMLLGVSCSLDESDAESAAVEEQLPAPIREDQSL